MRRRIGFVTLALAGAAALALGGVAIAQSGGDGKQAPEAEHEAFLADVADRLGVTTQELEDALQGAALARVDRALADGRITEAQAERMKEAIESGRIAPLARGFKDGRHGGFGLRNGGLHGALGAGLGAVTEYLGVTRAELLERLRSGDSLADVAEAEGKSVDGLEQAIVAAAEERLDAAVEAGRLTRERADAMLERLREHVDDLVQRSLPERMGRRGGPGLDF